jgi:GNAT superfamily N-acetyltransferase
MAADEPRTVDLDLGDPADRRVLERAYAEILVPSFTPDELLPIWAIRGDGGPPQDVAVRMAGDELLAVAVADHAGPDLISLLSYLAVRPGLRGGGHGGELLAHVGRRWAAKGAGLVLGEIHDPRAHAERDDEQPMARLRFYERHGAELLDVPWVQPAVSRDGDRMPGMLLIAFHRSGSFAGPRVPGEPLLTWADAYYDECEGPQPPDPERRALRARFAAPEGIEVRPLADFALVEPLAC